MLHPDLTVVDLGGPLGRRVLANRPIPRGTIVWVGHQEEEILTDAKRLRLSEQERQEWLELGWVNVNGDICLCGDDARYINHSCGPNSIETGHNMSLLVRSLEPGDELTEDYLFLNRRYAFRCLCDSANCRGAVQVIPGQLDGILERLDRLLHVACREVTEVPQPLWSIISQETATALQRAASGTERLPGPRPQLRPVPIDLDGILWPE